MDASDSYLLSGETSTATKIQDGASSNAERSLYEPVQFPFSVDKSWFVCTECDEVFASKTLLDEHTPLCLQKSDVDDADVQLASDGWYPSELMTSQSNDVSFGPDKRDLTPMLSADAAPESPYIDIVSIDDAESVIAKSNKANKDSSCDLDVTSLDVDDVMQDVDVDEVMPESEVEVPVKKKKSKKSPKSKKKKSKKSPKKIKQEKKTIFACAICGKMYVGRRAWFIHMRSHTGELPYVCAHCGKAFSSRFKQRRHELIHNSVLQRQFICPQCGGTFSRADHYKKHLTTHDPDKRKMVCEDCGKSYLTSFAYRVHLGFHQADKGVLKCIICAQDFDDKETLVLHLKKHAGVRSVCRKDAERRVGCQICEKKFYTFKDVRRHMLVHNKNRDFLCQFCARCFSRADHLLRHQRAKHAGRSNTENDDGDDDSLLLSAPASPPKKTRKSKTKKTPDGPFPSVSNSEDAVEIPPEAPVPEMVTMVTQIDDNTIDLIQADPCDVIAIGDDVSDKSARIVHFPYPVSYVGPDVYLRPEDVRGDDLLPNNQSVSLLLQRPYSVLTAQVQTIYSADQVVVKEPSPGLGLAPEVDHQYSSLERFNNKTDKLHEINLTPVQFERVQLLSEPAPITPIPPPYYVSNDVTTLPNSVTRYTLFDSLAPLPGEPLFAESASSLAYLGPTAPPPPPANDAMLSSASAEMKSYDKDILPGFKQTFQ